MTLDLGQMTRQTEEEKICYYCCLLIGISCMVAQSQLHGLLLFPRTGCTGYGIVLVSCLLALGCWCWESSPTTTATLTPSITNCLWRSGNKTQTSDVFCVVSVRHFHGVFYNLIFYDRVLKLNLL